MTGLDQDLMQKNLTCRTLRESQKNMFWFSASLLVVNLLFLTLGALLYLYCEAKGLSIPPSADALFPSLALHEFGLLAGIFFLLGIVASTYASADSALAGLTTSFCIDFLHFNQKPEVVKQRQKNLAHAGFSILILIIVLVFREINQRSLIDAILILTGYTYGPILGLFSFGLFTRRQLREKAVPLIAVMAPLISYGISSRSATWISGYTFGFEIIIVNGLLMFLGLWMISYSEKDSQVNG
jgi:Na+/proline symporter